jgi:hypothetical protein
MVFAEIVGACCASAGREARHVRWNFRSQFFRLDKKEYNSSFVQCNIKCSAASKKTTYGVDIA